MKTELTTNDDAYLATLPVELLAEGINDHHKQVLDCGSSMVQHAIDCGRWLVEAKGRCEHGEWLSWLDANCDMSEVHSQRYMRIAKTSRVTDLSDVTSIRECLALISEAKAEERARRALIGDEDTDVGRTNEDRSEKRP